MLAFWETISIRAIFFDIKFYTKHYTCQPIMFSTRRGSQGRYRCKYSTLQQNTQAIIPEETTGTVPHETPAADPQEVPAAITHDVPATIRQGPLLLRDVKVDKVSVSCSMLGGNDQQWGKLESMDVGVLKFLTTLAQEDGYRLDQITVDIYFTEHNPEDCELFLKNLALVLLKPPCPTKIIRGEPRKEHIIRKSSVYPKLQTPIGGGELGGSERTYETDFVRSWSYSCCWHGDRHGKLTMAKWMWEADHGDPQVQHVGPLYSGVVVGHLCQPFWVGCKIQPLLTRRGLSKYWKRYRGKSMDNDDKYKFTQIPLSPTNANLGTVVAGLDEEITQLMCSKRRPGRLTYFPGPNFHALIKAFQNEARTVISKGDNSIKTIFFL
jgi:hypothetical protein